MLAVFRHGEAKRRALQNYGNPTTVTKQPRRRELLRRSTATAAPMAALRRGRTRDGAKLNTAHLGHRWGRCKVETVGMVEAKLQARLIGEWSGGERRRARWSVCDGDGAVDARRLRCGEGESQKSEMGSAGQCGRVLGLM